jgi:AcrR family transcriptional regulator
MSLPSDADVPARVDGRRLRHEHRRPELLEALTEYVLEHGVAELSLRPAAEAIGVTHATLIRHFASKDELILEVVAKIRTDFLARLQRRLDASAAEELGDYLWTAWNLLCQPRERRQFILLFELVARDARMKRRSGRRGELVDSVIAAFVTPITERLIAEGRSADEADQLATVIVAQVRGLQLDLAVSGERRRVDRAMQRFIDLLVQPRR